MERDKLQEARDQAEDLKERLFEYHPENHGPAKWAVVNGWRGRAEDLVDKLNHLLEERAEKQET